MRRALLTLIIIFLISVTAYFHITWGENKNEDPLGFNTIAVQRRDIIQSIIATGIIKPKVGAEVKVGAQVSGVVTNLFVKIGSRVKKNDLLAIIDPRTYRSQREKMLALKEIALTDKKYAELEFRRYKTLYEQGAVTLREYEATMKQYELAQSRVQQAEAEFDYANLQLGYTEIFSPTNGVVSSITTQEGETVTSGLVAPTFVTIIDLDQLELWTYVDETDIGRVQKGQSVSFTVDTYPGEPFEGTVETIYPKAEIQNNVVNYVVVVKILPEKDKTLRPEMTATVQTYIQRKENVLVVPKKALQVENNRFFVTVLNKDIKEKRFISTGISDKKYYEVISGITEKEKVVLK